MGKPEWASNTLPPNLKMHELLKLAMDDLGATELACERGAPVRIDMSDWFYANDRKQGGEWVRVCEVCFAGGVMWQHLGVPVDGEGMHRSIALPHNFDKYTERCLLSLNKLRTGMVGEAYHNRGVRRVPHDLIPLVMPACDYKVSPTDFKRDMQRIYEVLLRFDP